MPPKRDLKAFLRKEIKKARIEAPPRPPSGHGQALGEPPLSLRRIKSFKKPGPSPLLGDTNTTNRDFRDNSRANSADKGMNASENRNLSAKDHLQQFPVSGSANNPTTPSKASQNSELYALRKELEDVVIREATAARHEKRAITKEKSALIQKISNLEGAERRARVEKIREPFNVTFASLPEPVTPDEKRNLMRNADLIVQARESPLTPSPKRRRDDLDDGLLDGEDRLKLGIKRSRDEKATGHWRTTLNDYMPESQVDTEMFNKVNSLTPEEKMADRALLNEYRRNTAIVDRYDKRMERKLEDMKQAK